jgi:hypothetical protein
VSKGFKKTFQQQNPNVNKAKSSLDIFFVPQGLFESKLVNLKNQLEASSSQTTIYQQAYNSIICNSGSISIKSGFSRSVVEGMD